MKFFKEKNLFQVIYEGKEGYVIIDKTEITNIKDHYGKYHLEKSNIINQFPDYLTDLDECKIIIASTFPLGDLPQFIVEEDFNTLNDDIDILRNFDYPNLIYEKDLSIKESNAYKNGLVIGYKKGWNKHAEKYKFTEEDMKKAIKMARSSNNHLVTFEDFVTPDYTEEEIIQSLQQLKEITEIEFKHIWENQKGIKGDNFTDIAIKQSDGEFDAWLALKITKSIKYPNGLLTIKNVKYE